MKFFHYALQKFFLKIIQIYQLQTNSMTQLSPLSSKALQKIKTVLAGVDRIAKSGKIVVTKDLPQMLRNIAYVFVVLKDIATFLPSALYKIVVGVVVLSFVVKYFRGKRRKGRKNGENREGKCTKQIQSQTLRELEQLGPEFQVKESLGPTGPGDTNQDSCCQDLTHQLYQSNDFRDIIFFQLMRGYSQEGQTERRQGGER